MKSIIQTVYDNVANRIVKGRPEPEIPFQDEPSCIDLELLDPLERVVRVTPCGEPLIEACPVKQDGVLKKVMNSRGNYIFFRHHSDNQPYSDNEEAFEWAEKVIGVSDSIFINCEHSLDRIPSKFRAVYVRLLDNVRNLDKTESEFDKQGRTYYEIGLVRDIQGNYKLVLIKRIGNRVFMDVISFDSDDNIDIYTCEPQFYGNACGQMKHTKASVYEKCEVYEAGQEECRKKLGDVVFEVLDDIYTIVNLSKTHKTKGFICAGI